LYEIIISADQDDQAACNVEIEPVI
jgi:hypothetical protein